MTQPVLVLPAKHRPIAPWTTVQHIADHCSLFSASLVHGALVITYDTIRNAILVCAQTLT